MTLERYAGQGARGPVFDAPEVGVRCSAQSIENLRVEWKDEEHLVKYLVMIRPELGKIPLGSRVTMSPGDVYRVVKIIPIPDWGPHPSHIELMLTSWGSL